MPEVKPSISELYESGGLDMWLVNKIAHNELDKSKGPLFNSVYALASEYIDAYIDDHEIYDIDAIIGSAEKMIALQGAPDGDLCLDDLAEAKGDEAEMVNEGIGTIGAGTLEGGDR